MENLAPSRHAILGASKADRWIACPPSARFEEQIIEAPSYFAEEGTLAHDLAALILSSRAGIFRGDQRKFNQMLSDHEARVFAFYALHDNPEAANEYNDMFTHAEGYAAFVRSLGGEISIEREVDFSQFVPLGFGTNDSRNKLPKALHITDYKYGAGKVVDVVKNGQLMLYGLGALLDILKTDPTYRPTEIWFHVYQPRNADGSDPVSSWSCTPEELLYWAEFEVAPRALLAIAGQGEFKTGDHCGFCKARTVCMAWYREFAKIERVRDKRQMTDADIAHVLSFGKDVAAFVKKVQGEAVRRFETKRPIEGWKLVAGKSVRKFKNEDIVVDVLLGEGWDSEKIFNSEVRALTDIEKELGKDRFEKLFNKHINRVPYANTIAPDTDGRQSITPLGAEEFDD